MRDCSIYSKAYKSRNRAIAQWAGGGFDLEQLRGLPGVGAGVAEVLVGGFGGDAAAGRALHESDLDQVRLIQILDGAAIFGNRGGERIHTHRTTAEPLDD